MGIKTAPANTHSSLSTKLENVDKSDHVYDLVVFTQKWDE